MVMSRYEFLQHMHEILRPEVYLEIGVQFGGSLALAERAGLAYGVDPVPQVRPEFQRPNQRIYPETSADFWACKPCERPTIDFAYIDGSHLFEDALADFAAIEAHLHSGSVVAFDDVLPYNQAIAEREQPPGDWTGDVWKVEGILHLVRGELLAYLVDVAPAGLLVMTGFDGGYLEDAVPIEEAYTKRVAEAHEMGSTVPEIVLTRGRALDAETVLADLAARTERGELGCRKS